VPAGFAPMRKLLVLSMVVAGALAQSRRYSWRSLGVIDVSHSPHAYCYRNPLESTGEKIRK